MSDGAPHKKITYLGKIDYRDKQVTFGIQDVDRTKHMYVIGKSGMGKSTLLENLAIQDITNGEGLCVIDPHGSFAEILLDYIPESRVKDVVYFAPSDGEYPMGLNMLEKVPAEKRYLLANGMMSAFKKIFTDGDGKGTFSARMEYVLNNIILALLENDGQTLLGVNRMLFDKEYRKFIVSNVTDPTVKDFWVNEYANYTDKTAQELAPAIQNKIGQFLSNPLIRNIVGQKKTSFDMRKIMDEKKILIVNLSKGKVGEGNANLLGSLLITKIYLAAMSRADIDPYEAEKLPPCYFYVDEFQNFANESFASILSEARKYKLALTVAHQYIEQMTDEVKSAVFGNVGTMITFRIGATDAEVFEKEFAPKFILDDFVNLSAYQIYLRLMIDGQGSQPFSAKTLPRPMRPVQSYAQAVIAYSRSTYAKPKFMVEDEIMEFYKPAPKVEKKKEEGVPFEGKFLKVNEYKHDTPFPPQRNERSEKNDRDNNIKRYDVPKQNSNITRYDTPKKDTSGEQREISRPNLGEQQNVVVSQIKKVETTEEIKIVTETTSPQVDVVSTEKQTINTAQVSPTIIAKDTTPVPQKIHTPHAVQHQAQQSQEPASTPQPHIRPQHSAQHYNQQTQSRAPQASQNAPSFDDKPAMSLKEALAKALSEHSAVPEKSVSVLVSNKESVTEQTQNSHKETVKHSKSNGYTEHTEHTEHKEEKKRKEVAEDILRKLIEEE